MKVSTKGRYALRLMLDLIENQEKGLARIKEISERQGLSEKYLEQIITPLNRAGYVRSVRGAQGGYMIAINPETVTVGMILRLMEGSLSPVECVAEHGPECERSDICKTFPLWKKIDTAINDIVDTVTLADLVNERI